MDFIEIRGTKVIRHCVPGIRHGKYKFLYQLERCFSTTRGLPRKPAEAGPRQWWLWSSTVLILILLTIAVASFAFPAMLTSSPWNRLSIRSI